MDEITVATVNHFEKFRDRKLPHQLRILYHSDNDLKATCNCAKWEVIFSPEEPMVIEDIVIPGYKDHLPILE